MPAHDVLARFRGPNYAPPVDQGASRKYVAFRESSEPKRRLWLKCASVGMPNSYQPYAYMLDIDTDDFAVIGLNYVGPYQVVIQGENLGLLVQALREDRADWIEIFSPDKHDMPGEEEPIVRGIEIIKFRPDPDPDPSEMN